MTSAKNNNLLLTHPQTLGQSLHHHLQKEHSQGLLPRHPWITPSQSDACISSPQLGFAAQLSSCHRI